MYRWSLIITFLFITNLVKTQNETISKLKVELQNTSIENDLESHIKLSIAIAREYYNIQVNQYNSGVELLAPLLDEYENQIPYQLKGELNCALARGYSQDLLYGYDEVLAKKVFSLYEEALPYLENRDTDYIKAISYAKYATALMVSNQIEKANLNYEKSLRIFETIGELNIEWGFVLNNLASVKGNLGDDKQFLQLNQQAKELTDSIPNEVGINLVRFVACLNLGDQFANYDQLKDAEENYLLALEAGKKSNIPFYEASASIKLCEVKMDLQDTGTESLSEIREMLDQATVIFKENQAPSFEAQGYEELSRYFLFKNSIDSALIYSQKGFSIVQNLGDEVLLKESKLKRGQIFLETEQLDSARIYLMESSLEGNDLRSMRQIFKLRSKLEEQSGNYKSALENAKKLAEAQDSIFNENIINALGRESVILDVEGAEQAKANAELKAELLSSQNNLFLALTFGMLLILLVGGYLFYQLSKTRKQLQSQNLQLKELNATKDKFFGIIAHDIRNPITALQGVGEQIDFYIKKGDNDRLKRLTDSIDDTSSRLSDLLNNLLNWALLQTGMIPYNPESVSVNEAIQETFQLLEHQASSKEIKLINEVNEDDLVHADALALKTVIRNLTSNAIKFTSKGGSVRLNTEERNNSLFITVNDTGTGISAEKIKHIFDLNGKSSSGTSGETGTGLGLVLCKELIELNNGTIKVLSELGKGSSFTFSLPKN